ncbi:MAG: hypothetical protein DRH76_11235 [Deltaproteobacteria bacterium]|nr:flagellar hook-length control protein FliK [Deltaproteobacteria bacterium]RLB92494.1 MAG: hypothetical protein DRH76_11235 [Deltaproteobacteria bacterium]
MQSPYPLLYRGPICATLRLQKEQGLDLSSLLREGEIIEGRVAKHIAPTKVLLLIKGREVIARTSAPLKEGETVSLEVLKTFPVTKLKLLMEKGTEFPPSRISQIPPVVKENPWGALFDIIRRRDRQKGPLTLLKKSADTMADIQLPNCGGTPEGRTIFLPLAVDFSWGRSTLGQLLIRLPRKDENLGDRKGKARKPYKVTFLLDLLHLGPIRADLQIIDKEIRASFLTARDETRRVLSNSVARFVSILNAKGFLVHDIQCRLNDAETIQESFLKEIYEREGESINLFV